MYLLAPMHWYSLEREAINYLVWFHGLRVLIIKYFAAAPRVGGLYRTKEQKVTYSLPLSLSSPLQGNFDSNNLVSADELIGTCILHPRSSF